MMLFGSLKGGMREKREVYRRDKELFTTWTVSEEGKETVVLEWASGESSNLGSGFQVVVETSNDSRYIFTFSQDGNDIVYVVSIEKLSPTEFLLSGSDDGTYIKRN